MRRELSIQRAVLVVVTLLVLIQSSVADFQSISIEYHTTIQTANGPREVYRIYARFNQPGDLLYAWGINISQPNQPFVLRTVLCSTYAPGNNFYNPQGGGIIAPNLATLKQFPLAEFDSFVTLGVSIGEQGASPPGEYADGTLVLFGFDGIPAANSVSSNSAYIWTAANAEEQGRANYPGDGDSQLRVLIMQVGVRPDNQVLFTIPYLSYTPEGRTNEQVVSGLTNDVLLPTGRCCMNNGACTQIPHPHCVVYGGTFLGCQPCESCAPTCPADISPVPTPTKSGGDGEVNIDDLVAVITSWGQCPNPPYCRADVSPFRGDGLVTIDDLVAVITSWGACP